MFTNFLIACSGANKEVLKECPLEKTKFIGIGLTNVLIAILSSVSVGFFVSFAFTDKKTGSLEITWYALLAVCIVWGLLIFNLDRSIIISIKKTGSTRRQFMQALPRIIIAVFIGIVISTPLELKIFADEIKVQLEKNLKKDIQMMKEENSQLHHNALKRADSMLALEQLSLRASETKRSDLNADMIRELEGQGFSKKGGAGRIYSDKKAAYDKQDSLYQLQAAVTLKATKARDSILGKIRGADTRDESVIDNVDGPSAQIVALYQLPGVHWFVTLLFILIETMPVVVKLMSSRGTYDELIERHEMGLRLKEEVIIADKKSKRDYALTELDEINRLESELRLTKERRRIAKEMSLADVEIPSEAPSIYESQLNTQFVTDVAKPSDISIAEEGTSNKDPEPETFASKDQLQATNGIDLGTVTTETKEQGPNNKFSFENKIWKDEQASDRIQYRFVRDAHAQKLLQTVNSLEKTGRWAYDEDRKLLVLNIEGTHREYNIISESNTAMKLKSLMGKELNLVSV